jgi:8-amino-7-oxononanoate synthase
MSESALAQKLTVALASREDRNIRRRLPLALPINFSNHLRCGHHYGHQSHAPRPDSASADFSSNDYNSLSASPLLRARVLATLHSSPAILGSGGSRLLAYNRAHTALAARLARTFRSPAALLFNSGFDANAGFFACVMQSGDALLYDEAIASVYDGARVSRIAAHMHRPFAHNDVRPRSVRFGPSG